MICLFTSSILPPSEDLLFQQNKKRGLNNQCQREVYKELPDDVLKVFRKAHRKLGRFHPHGLPGRWAHRNVSNSSEGISFFMGVWGSLGYLPRVCWQNHWLRSGSPFLLIFCSRRMSLFWGLDVYIIFQGLKMMILHRFFFVMFKQELTSMTSIFLGTRPDIFCLLDWLEKWMSRFIFYLNMGWFS